MVAIILFGISLLGLIAFLFFKRWEVRQEDATLYRQKRTVLDHLVVRLGKRLSVIPHFLRDFLLHAFHAIVFHVSAFVLRVVRFVERRLLRFVNMVRGKREIHHKKGSASLFLTSISEERYGAPKEE